MIRFQNAFFATIILLTGATQANAKHMSVDCYNSKESIYIWFCLNEGKLESKGCVDPHVKFVAEQNEEGIRPRIQVLIKKVQFSLTKDLKLQVYLSKSEEEPNTMLKMLDIPAAKLKRQTDYTKEYQGTGQLTLPKDLVEHLKSQKVNFDLSETYTCSVQ